MSIANSSVVQPPSRLEASAPRVSVVICFFNGEPYLAEAVASVFAQRYEDRELLLVNDGSTDASPETARRVAERFPSRAHLLTHSNGENRELSASRNLGIERAKGGVHRLPRCGRCLAT